MKETSWRVPLTVAAVLAAGTISGGQTLWHAVHTGPNYRSCRLVDEYENERFTRLRPFLPRQGVIGYLHDPRGEADSAGRAYYLSQYTLNPLILAEEVESPLVVANFLTPSHRPVPPPGRRLVVRVKGRSPAEPARSLLLIADPGNGVQCYRSEAAPWPH